MLARELGVGKASAYCPITMPAHREPESGGPTRTPPKAVGVEPGGVPKSLGGTLGWEVWGIARGRLNDRPFIDALQANGSFNPSPTTGDAVSGPLESSKSRSAHHLAALNLS
jgi:hypothetical protein